MRVLLVFIIPFFIAVMSGVWSYVDLDYRTTFDRAIKDNDYELSTETASVWIINVPKCESLEVARYIGNTFLEEGIDLIYADLILTGAVRKFKRDPDLYNIDSLYGDDWICYKDEILLDLLYLRSKINGRLGRLEIQKSLDDELSALTEISSLP